MITVMIYKSYYDYFAFQISIDNNSLEFNLTEPLCSLAFVPVDLSLYTLEGVRSVPPNRVIELSDMATWAII